MDKELFGPYVLLELIGRGGMGEVFTALDTERKRTVALKRLPSLLSTDEAFQARFRRESEIAARLNDPHIVPIHDYGQIDGQLYLDMRLVEGRDLATLLAQHGALGAADAVSLVRQIAGALDSAHAGGLVHRDVKPSNILIATREQPGVDLFAYLTDFGIARNSGGDTSLTTTNATAGTLDYMAPERFADDTKLDRRVDVYSLACVFHEALTGDKPFPARGMPAAIHAHLHLDPPRPSQHVPGLPSGFDDVVRRGMAKDPAERFATTLELADAARAALEASQPAVHEPVSAGAAVTAWPPLEPAPAAVSAAPITGESTIVPTGSGPAGEDVPAPDVVQDSPPRRRLLYVSAAVGVAALVAATVVVVGQSGASGGPPTAAVAAPTATQAPAAPAASSGGERAVVPVAVVPAIDRGVFAGRSSGNEVTVAVSVKDGHAVAYVCDGKRIESWLNGTLVGDKLAMHSEYGGTVTANLAQGSAFGTIVVDGKAPMPFSAEIVTKPAGLYVGTAKINGAKIQAGWIVLPNGQQVGLLERGEDETAPAPVLDPQKLSARDGGTALSVSEVDGGSDIEWD